MKPQLLKVHTGPVYSFSVRQDRLPNINNRWHYHPEVELIQFHKGGGTQFVGDHIKRFGAGDIVLIGSNLPHYWHYDDSYFQDDAPKTPYSTVIHFTETFWGDRFINLPENKPLKTLLEKAKRGILLSSQANPQVVDSFEKIPHAEGPYRIIYLMECLLAMAHSPDVQVLSSIGFQSKFSLAENERINAIYEYTLKHFQQKITLEQIASVAGLVPGSFCRYFKSRAGKPFSQFLTEIRIGYACKLVLDGHLSVKQLCYESGFNNFTCFHKNFKAITGKSPLDYQKAFASKFGFQQPNS
ncbi:helix-turn-helix domain-containing protein [Rhodocytophaga aerolata]|uniref:Helix-turn-helix domain-containing protein n=1 Tax=Rhodocytophaga aerolata TaxID=455078 RepID=A0ABT8R1M9_9BACT|nr:helix-turn-helix domain-containing protein [Rhodocytophaga aerolata]MDO1445541.1 helix-turn-helix domain-containing protein [Rhodocytophaga aerolata]